MQLILTQLALGFNLLSIGLALPSENVPFGQPVSRRALTPDNTCGITGGGGGKGYTCDPTLFQGGNCCSVNGYCGK